MSRINDMVKKYREVITYLIFGVLTTVVSWLLYFAIMAIGRKALGMRPEEVDTGRYLAVYTTSQIISWIGAVLFSFFTNRKWVFVDADRTVKIGKQLMIFASGRLITLGLDYVITYAGTYLMTRGFRELTSFRISLGNIERTVNLCEITAKLAAAVVVVIGNYVFGKIFVFKKKDGDKR